MGGSDDEAADVERQQALEVEERGEAFVGPAVKVYAGQIIGLNKRQDDMEMNVCKAKHLTNMRSSSSDWVRRSVNGTDELTDETTVRMESSRSSGSRPVRIAKCVGPAAARAPD